MTTTVTIKPRPAVFPDPVTYIVEQDLCSPLEVTVTQSGMGYKFEVDAPDASAAEKAIAAVSDFIFGEAPAAKVEEVSFSEWMNSTELQDKFEFEGTNCADCRTSIGGYLGYNEETTADVPKFDSIWVLPDGKAVCEDCIPEGMEY